MFKTPIVMLDFETTGLSPDSGDRITEVAALRIVGDRIVER
ncbi:MAG: 3'-5' exonuclease, partial [Burkholderiales bacterium]|nr:3'-5' exonuclease [Burkholderiales bacterium]